MTASPRLATSFLRAELSRLGLDEWAFVRECNRAERCSVNVCPMDPLVALRATDPVYPERRCPVSKPDRERFFSRLPCERQALLPFQGLLETEWKRRQAGRRRFASASPELLVKLQAGREKGRAALKAARLSIRTIPATSGATPIPSGEASSLKACITGGELAPPGTMSLSESISEEVPILRRGSTGSGRIGSGRSGRP